MKLNPGKSIFKRGSIMVKVQCKDKNIKFGPLINLL